MADNMVKGCSVGAGLASRATRLTITDNHPRWSIATSTGGDHRAAFDGYQRQFKPFMDAKQRVAARNRWWFAPRTAAGVWLRNRARHLVALSYLGDFLIGRSLGGRFILPV